MAVNDYLMGLVPGHPNVHLRHMGTQTLVTRRMVLTRLTKTDITQPSEWAHDPGSYSWDSKLPFPPGTFAGFVKERIRAYADPRIYYWVLHERVPASAQDALATENGVTYCADSIGVLYVNSIMGMGTCAELDNVLSKRFWQRDLMAEAMGTVLDYLFEQVGFHRVSVRMRIDCKPAARMLRQLFFREDGVLREYFPDLEREDSWSDAVVYSILSNEWAQAKAALAKG